MHSLNYHPSTVFNKHALHKKNVFKDNNQPACREQVFGVSCACFMLHIYVFLCLCLCGWMCVWCVCVSTCKYA